MMCVKLLFLLATLIHGIVRAIPLLLISQLIVTGLALPIGLSFAVRSSWAVCSKSMSPWRSSLGGGHPVPLCQKLGLQAVFVAASHAYLGLSVYRLVFATCKLPRVECFTIRARLSRPCLHQV